MGITRIIGRPFPEHEQGQAQTESENKYRCQREARSLDERPEGIFDVVHSHATEAIMKRHKQPFMPKLYREPHVIASDLMKVSNTLEELGYDINRNIGQGVSVELFLLNDRLRRMSLEILDRDGCSVDAETYPDGKRSA